MTLALVFLAAYAWLWVWSEPTIEERAIFERYVQTRCEQCATCKHKDKP